MKTWFNNGDTNKNKTKSKKGMLGDEVKKAEKLGRQLRFREEDFDEETEQAEPTNVKDKIKASFNFKGHSEPSTDREEWLKVAQEQKENHKPEIQKSSPFPVQRTPIQMSSPFPPKPQRVEEPAPIKTQSIDEAVPPWLNSVTTQADAVRVHKEDIEHVEAVVEQEHKMSLRDRAKSIIKGAPKTDIIDLPKECVNEEKVQIKAKNDVEPTTVKEEPQVIKPIIVSEEIQKITPVTVSEEVKVATPVEANEEVKVITPIETSDSERCKTPEETGKSEKWKIPVATDESDKWKISDSEKWKTPDEISKKAKKLAPISVSEEEIIKPIRVSGVEKVAEPTMASKETSQMKSSLQNDNKTPKKDYTKRGYTSVYQSLDETSYSESYEPVVSYKKTSVEVETMVEDVVEPIDTILYTGMPSLMPEEGLNQYIEPPIVSDSYQTKDSYQRLYEEELLKNSLLQSVITESEYIQEEIVPYEVESNPVEEPVYEEVKSEIEEPVYKEVKSEIEEPVYKEVKSEIEESAYEEAKNEVDEQLHEELKLEVEEPIYEDDNLMKQVESNQTDETGDSFEEDLRRLREAFGDPSLDSTGEVAAHLDIIEIEEEIEHNSNELVEDMLTFIPQTAHKETIQAEAEVEIEPIPELELEPKLELQPEAEVEIEPIPELELEPKLELQPEAELEIEPIPELELEPRLELQPEAEVEIEPIPELELEPRLELQPKVELEIEPTPESESEVEPKLELEPETEYVELAEHYDVLDEVACSSEQVDEQLSTVVEDTPVEMKEEPVEEILASDTVSPVLEEVTEASIEVMRGKTEAMLKNFENTTDQRTTQVLTASISIQFTESNTTALNSNIGNVIMTLNSSGEKFDFTITKDDQNNQNLNIVTSAKVISKVLALFD